MLCADVRLCWTQSFNVSTQSDPFFSDHFINEVTFPFTKLGIPKQSVLLKAVADELMK